VIRHDVHRLDFVPLVRPVPVRRVTDREVDVGTDTRTRMTDGSSYADGASAKRHDREQSQERDRGRKRPSS